MPLEPGLILNNRYRIVETNAVGGMSAVYKALDEPLGIYVAVKENFFTTNEFSRQFRREATILAKLRHPNLPRVTDHFVIEGQGQYLVMDYIDGEDLRQLISQRGLLSVYDVLQIGVAICDALAYLHTRSPAIVHRDIKPGNIKVTSKGQVVLVDFGLAKLSRGEATTSGAQALTPGYAPPEQYGQGTEPRSDIYALGATLYASLTGVIPEDGLSRLMETAELTPIRIHCPAIGEQAAQAIEKSMAVRPEDRYPDADQFKSALVEAARLTGEQHKTALLTSNPPLEDVPDGQAQPKEKTALSKPIAVKPIPQPALPVDSRPVRKRNAMPFLFGFGGIVVITALALFLFNQRNGKPAVALQPSPTAITTTALPAAATQPVLSTVDTLSPQPATSPAATHTPAQPTGTAVPPDNIEKATVTATPLGGSEGWIAFASDRSGTTQIWIMNSDGGEPRQVTNLVDGACQPNWSPDGLRLVFISPCSELADIYPGASLFLINADGAGLQPLVSQPGGDFDPAWSPDGSTIAFTSLRDGRIPHIYLYKLADQTTHRVSSVSNHEQHPVWSPDGLLIAYQTNRTEQYQIWTMAPDGSNAREFSSFEGGISFSPDWSPDGMTILYVRSPSNRWLMGRETDNPTAGEFVLTDHINSVYDPDFSTDGFWIAISSTQQGNADIYRMQRNGGDLKALTTDPAFDFHPAWQP